MEKEANRFIRQWPEEKIAIENGRWGAFIRFGKKMLKLGLNKANTKYTPEELAAIDLEDVKKMILTQEPKAFDKKAPAKRRRLLRRKSNFFMFDI
jgi:DNA topoisomerase-1